MNKVIELGKQFLLDGTNHPLGQIFTDGAWGSNQLHNEYLFKKEEVDQELAKMGLAVHCTYGIGEQIIYDAIFLVFRNLEDDFFPIDNEKRVWRPARRWVTKI